MASLGDDSSVSETSTGTGHKRAASNALQLGPRKKPFVILIYVLEMQRNICLLEQLRTPWSIMDDTSVALFMHSAICRVFS
jgi:hypothetical protein